MWLSTSPGVLRGAIFSSLILLTSADRIFQSSSLATCQSDSSITASLFNIAFTPDNQTLTVDVVGEALVEGNVTFKVQAAAYGYVFLTETIDPCAAENKIASFCPLSLLQIGLDVTYTNISTNFIGRIPGIAYQIPDLDATVTINIYSTNNTNVSIGCVELKISNGKTVNELGIRWATAVVAAIGLLTSLLIGSLGHTNAAAHIAIYAFALFSYFQSLALIGLCAVPLPPIVQAWTQDFVWSLGIIKVPFLQRFATWYQLATNGTPTTILKTLGTKSVEVLKRGLSSDSASRGSLLSRRAQIPTTTGGEYLVKGIQRVAFRENMEPTNLFFTAVTFYCIIIIITLLIVVLFKKLSELLIRLKWVKSENPIFDSFRNDWHVTLKGVIFRLILIGYLPMTALSFWEFTQIDSPGEVVLAVLFLFGLTAALAIAAFHVTRVAKRSEELHKTPAYLLYSNPAVLHKWGALYVPFRASASFYIIPTLIYILIKSAFVGLAQKSGVAQSIALIVIEAVALVSASVVRPWMDKSTNGIHISIFAVNFLNAVFFLIFTDIFNGPGLLRGVVGIIFFFLNVVFAFVLLVMVLVVAAISVFKKNPDERYRSVKDDRASFRQSRTALTTELDDLGVVARGEGKFEHRGSGSL
jgi:hypothetical protein